MAHLMETMKTIVERETTTAGASEVAQELAAGISVDPPPQPTEPVWRAGDPDVSDMVIYQPRRGEIRRGRKRIAAMVTHRYPDARVLDLAIIYEASDTMDQQRVPEAVGEERGWIVKNATLLDRLPPDARVTVNHAPREIAEISASLADLRAIVMGEFETPANSILDMLCELDERVDKLMALPDVLHLAAPKAPKSKKRGK